MKDGKIDLVSLPYELSLLTLDDISQLSYEDLKKLASYGRADAQFLVGEAMTRGKIVIKIEVPKDYNNALELYKKAAYEGYKPAQKILADIYFVGGRESDDSMNFPKNYKQAYVWYYVYGYRSISEEYGFLGRIWQRFYRNVCSLGASLTKLLIGFLVIMQVKKMIAVFILLLICLKEKVCLILGNFQILK